MALGSRMEGQREEVAADSRSWAASGLTRIDPMLFGPDTVLEIK
jgi:hypothetical protein